MTGSAHTYRSTVAWTGTTGEGYDAYDRRHTATVPPSTTEIAMASDPAFRGDPALANPEQLLVLAASSCQLLSFLAVAARARLDVVAYSDEASGLMPEGERPMWLTRITLRPMITLATAGGAPEVSDDRLRHLCEVAHRECFIANSLRTEVVVEPSFRRTATRSPAV